MTPDTALELVATIRQCESLNDQATDRLSRLTFLRSAGYQETDATMIEARSDYLRQQQRADTALALVLTELYHAFQGSTP